MALTVSKLFYYCQSTQDYWDGVYLIETHFGKEGKKERSDGGREGENEGEIDATKQTQAPKNMSERSPPFHGFKKSGIQALDSRTKQYTQLTNYVRFWILDAALKIRGAYAITKKTELDELRTPTYISHSPSRSRWLLGQERKAQ